MRGKITSRRRYDLAIGTFVEDLRYFIDGVEVTQEAYREAFPDRPLSETALFSAPRPCEFEPIHSEALGYHPRQREQALAQFQRLGIGDTQIDAMGRPVLRDREHRKRVLKALGVHANNSYGND